MNYYIREVKDMFAAVGIRPSQVHYALVSKAVTVPDKVKYRHKMITPSVIKDLERLFKVKIKK